MSPCFALWKPGKARPSFLKKRSKRLLTPLSRPSWIQARVGGNNEAPAHANRNKSFLVLHFKKGLLAFCSTEFSHTQFFRLRHYPALRKRDHRRAAEPSALRLLDLGRKTKLSGSNRQVLPQRSAFRYDDGNPLPLIGSKMANIERRLALPKPGQPNPTPDPRSTIKPCLKPTLRHTDYGATEPRQSVQG